MQGNLGQAEASIAGGPAGNTSMLPEKKEIEEKEEGIQYSKIWKKIRVWLEIKSRFN